MKNIIILCCILLCNNWLMAADEYHCSKIISSSQLSNNNGLYKYAQDKLGNYYICGEFKNNFQMGNEGTSSNAAYSYFIAKINKNDSVIYVKTLAESHSSISCIINIDTANQIIGAINFTNSVTFRDTLCLALNSNLNTSFILAKLDENANLIWKKTLNGNYENGAASIVSDNYNNIVINGVFGRGSSVFTPSAYLDVGGDTLYTFAANFFIAKYSSNGSLLWAKQGGSSNVDDGGQQIVVDANNNIYSVAYITPTHNIYFDTTLYLFGYSKYDLSILVKYDENGNLRWIRGFCTTNFPDVASIGAATSIVVKNNNVMLTGYYSSANGVLVEGYGTIPSNTTSNIGLNNVFLINYDTLGNVRFAKKIHTVYSDEYPNGLAARSDSNYFYLATTIQGCTISNNNTFCPMGHEILLEKFDTLGNKIWYKIIKDDVNSCSGRGVIINDKNEILVMGNSAGNKISCDAKRHYPTDIPTLFVARLSQGDVNWNDTLNGFEEVIESKEQLVVYPNPVSNMLICKCANMLMNTIEITDVLGRVCTIPPFQREVGGFELNISNLPSGIYFIKTTDTNGNQLNGKFVKQ